MRAIAALAVAVLAIACPSANPKELKLRCENLEAEYSMSTLYIDESTGRITEIWDADGYEETSQGTFEDGVWSWKVVTDKPLESQALLMT